MVGGIWHAGSSLLPLAWMICLWSHSNEELKLWNFSSFHWKADRRRRSVVKDTGELTHFWISQVAPRLRICLQCWRHRRHGFDPWVGKISWKGECQPTPVFLPGQPHGQRSLVGYSPWGHKESDNDWSHTPHTRQPLIWKYLWGITIPVTGRQRAWAFPIHSEILVNDGAELSCRASRKVEAPLEPRHRNYTLLHV